MAIAADPEDERRARRLGIRVRVVFYPLALGLIVLAWQHYHGGDAPQAYPLPVVEWNGVTSQNRPIHATSIKGGVVRSLFTTVQERCDDGSFFTFNWFSAQRHFLQRGDSMSGREAGGGHANN